MGILAGLVMGYAARRAHFCTMGAFERYWYADDASGLRTWFLAGATAILATQSMSFLGWIEVSQSFYLFPRFSLTAAVIGGVVFGIGMALVGTCGFGALVRIGGGSLRSLIVVIMIALSALAIQKGVLSDLRYWLVEPAAVSLAFSGDQSLPSLAAFYAGEWVRLPLIAAIAGLALALIFGNAKFRRSKVRISSGVAIGLTVSAGWLITSWASRNAFEPVQVESASFVQPLGDVIQMLIATPFHADYGVGMVFGVLAGSALSAWRAKDMRLEACDDAKELGRHLAGGFFMGTGGVLAAGCTIGQGVSAMSLLTISAPIVLASIALGARLGLSYLIEGSLLAAFSRKSGAAAR